MTESHEATAKGIVERHYSYGPKSDMIDAIAAALASRDAEIEDAFQRGWKAGNDAQDGQDAVIAELRAELIALERESIAETQECNQLRAKLAEADARVVNYYVEAERHLAAMHELVCGLRTKLAAMYERSDSRDDEIEREGFVRGMERAREVPIPVTTFHSTLIMDGFVQGVQAKNDAIAAEIAIRPEITAFKALKAKLAEAERERDDWKIAHALEDEMGSRLVVERDAAFVRLEQFAADYPCHCAKNYPGTTRYHGHDCENAVVQDFVAEFVAEIDKAGKA